MPAVVTPRWSLAGWGPGGEFGDGFPVAEFFAQLGEVEGDGAQDVAVAADVEERADPGRRPGYL